MTDEAEALRAARNAHAGKRVAGEPTDEREHFYQCAACGQYVDKRRLGDVFHHEDAGHGPIAEDA